MPPTRLSDPLERAFSYREEGPSRKLPKFFGFHEQNRGGLAISTHHIHEVANSILSGVITNRYKAVDVVRVPQNAIQAWRSFNQRKCNSDALMPKYSPEMRLACITKTHFSHAVKLALDGGRWDSEAAEER